MCLISLIMIVYVFWVLQIANIQLNDACRDIVNLTLFVGDMFYGETLRIYSYDIDFSYLSSIIVYAVLFYLLHLIVEFIKNMEQQVQISINKIKRSEEKKLNDELQANFLKEEFKIKNGMLMLDIKSISIKRSWNSEEKKGFTSSELINLLLTELEKNNIHFKYEIFNGKLLLDLDNLSQFDMNLNKLIVILKRMQEDLYRDYCNITWCIATDVYLNEKDRAWKIPRLSKTLEVFSINGAICLATFKLRYELNPVRKYKLVSQGVFNIQEDNLEVFKLEKN